MGKVFNSIIRYFDLQSGRRTQVTESQNSGAEHAPVLPQYFVVSAGVIVEPFLRSYINSGIWSVDWNAIAGRTVFGLIVGLVILPGVYRASFDTQKPILVQLIALFPIGLGWESIFNAAVKTVGG